MRSACSFVVDRSDLNGVDSIEKEAEAGVEDSAIQHFDVRRGKSQRALVRRCNDAANETAAFGVLQFSSILK